jgi:hypothetical protein
MIGLQTLQMNPLLTLECGAMEFNTQHGMDWNRWIREGVPYVTARGEDALKRHYLPEDCTAPADDWSAGVAPEPAPVVVKPPRKPLTLVVEADKVFVEQAKTHLEQWLQQAASDDKEFIMPDCNSFLRLALYEMVSRDFPALQTETKMISNAVTGRVMPRLAVGRFTEAEIQAKSAAATGTCVHVTG